jgi:hypothetical protein
MTLFSFTDSDNNIGRLWPLTNKEEINEDTMKNHFPNSPAPVAMAQAHLGKILRPGDHAVDGTAGNGHDSLFLAQCVGKNGRLTVFDLQKSAIESSQKRFLDQNIETPVKWVQDSHGKLDEYVSKPIHGAIFNLGYLPGGDKSIITQSESTLEALDALAELLESGGGISIVAYTGHEGGLAEYQAVRNWARQQDKADWVFNEWSRLNREAAPVVILGEKRRRLASN